MTTPRRADAAFSGCALIPDLFALAFRRAVELLPGADIAALHKHRGRGTNALAWPAAAQMAQAAALLDALAHREEASRYRLRKPERDALLAAIGEDALDDGRRMFLLALAIDDAFSEYANDRPPGSAVVAPVSRGFFHDHTNFPPPLGQMTPLAVCRRWFQRFGYVGKVEGLDALGTMPSWSVLRPNARVEQALQGARDDDELRVALVTWRRHRSAALTLHASAPGCFAVAGLGTAARPGLLEDVVDRLSEARAHVALLPELALDDGDLARLRELLRTRARRFPALVATGLAHRPVVSGTSHVNEAVLLDARGNEILRHEKLEPYTDPTGRLEDIVPRQSEAYTLLDTPVGRIVLNICRDVRSDVPMFLNRVLGASMVLVPAYSPKLAFALEEARILGARQLACTFVTNPLCEDLSDATGAYVPIRGKTGEMSTQQAPLLGRGGDVVVQVCRLHFGAGRVGALDASTFSDA